MGSCEKRLFSKLSLILFVLLLSVSLAPSVIFATDDMICTSCAVNQQCTCELKLDGDACTSGLFIGFNTDKTPLITSIIESVPPTTVSFTPVGEGKIKLIGICFTPKLVVFKKEIEIKKPTFLDCPSTCSVGDNCACTVNNCTDGLYILINKKNKPVDYNKYSPVNSINANPYKNTFIPQENGNVKVIGVCFSSSKFKTAEIEITGQPIPPLPTCTSCRDGTVCGGTNAQGLTCTCRDADSDGNNDICVLTPW